MDSQSQSGIQNDGHRYCEVPRGRVREEESERMSKWVSREKKPDIKVSPPANELHEGKGPDLFILAQIGMGGICTELKINRSSQRLILLRVQLFSLVIPQPVAALQGLRKKLPAFNNSS